MLAKCYSCQGLVVAKLHYRGRQRDPDRFSSLPYGTQPRWEQGQPPSGWAYLQILSCWVSIKAAQPLDLTSCLDERGGGRGRQAIQTEERGCPCGLGPQAIGHTAQKWGPPQPGSPVTRN